MSAEIRRQKQAARRKRDAAEELYEAALIGKRNAEWKLDHSQTRTARILAAEDLRAIDAAIVKASRRPA